MSRWIGAAARELVGVWCHLDRRIHRATNRISRVLAGVAWAGSNPDERASLGFALHDALEHTTTRASAGLFEWERRWFERSLPAPPGRVLVGAAGSGREVLALLDEGYGVDAFEPAIQAYAALRGNVEGRARTWQLSYQQLSTFRGQHDGRDLPQGPYDAVVLGWGSLACVLEDEERLRLMRSCDDLCPNGPILASFAARQGVLRHGLGPAGGAAASLLGTPVPPDVVFSTNAGFMRPLTRAEAEVLGDSIGRSTRWEQPSFAHVSWSRPSTRG